MSENDTYIRNQELELHRAKTFRVELVKMRHGLPGEMTMKWTHNGFQWQEHSFTPQERIKLIKTLLESL